jgi:hypothetical protein
VKYQDRQTALGSWYGAVEMILPEPEAKAISSLGQSVYPDIALHISNYYINITIIVSEEIYCNTLEVKGESVSAMIKMTKIFSVVNSMERKLAGILMQTFNHHGDYRG